MSKPRETARQIAEQAARDLSLKLLRTGTCIHIAVEPDVANDIEATCRAAAEMLASLTADLAQANILAETRLAHCTSVDKQLDKRDADLAQAQQERGVKQETFNHALELADKFLRQRDEAEAKLAAAEQARDEALVVPHEALKDAVGLVASERNRWEGHDQRTHQHWADVYTQLASLLLVVEVRIDQAQQSAALTALLEAAKELSLQFGGDIMAVSRIVAWLITRAGGPQT